MWAKAAQIKCTFRVLLATGRTPLTCLRRVPSSVAVSSAGETSKARAIFRSEVTRRVKPSSARAIVLRETPASWANSVCVRARDRRIRRSEGVRRGRGWVMSRSGRVPERNNSGPTRPRLPGCHIRFSRSFRSTKQERPLMSARAGHQGSTGVQTRIASIALWSG